MASYFNSKDDILRAGLNVSRSQCLAFINVVEKTQGIIIMRHSRFFVWLVQAASASHPFPGTIGLVLTGGLSRPTTKASSRSQAAVPASHQLSRSVAMLEWF